MIAMEEHNKRIECDNVARLHHSSITQKDNHVKIYFVHR